MRLTFFAAIIGCALLAAPAQAAFAIRIGDGSVAPNGTTSVNVWISSADPGGDSLSMFGLELQITPTGSLQFTSPQSGAELSNPNYVFSDFGSTNISNGGTSVTLLGAANDGYIGGDGLETWDNVVPIGGSEKLLAVLDLTALGASGEYKVSIVSGPNTFFLNSNFEERGWSQAIDQTSGTVTVAGVNAVPAPPGLVLALTGAVPMLGWALRRRWLGAAANAA